MAKVLSMLNIAIHIGGSILLAGLLYCIHSRILPSLRDEQDLTTAVKVWLDLWLPLVLSVVYAVAIAAIKPIVTAQDTPQIWWSIAPVTASTLLGAGLCFFVTHRSGYNAMPIPFQTRSGWLLFFLGLVLIVASFADRISLSQGQVFFTGALIWLWICSPTPVKERASGASESRGKQIKGTSHRGKLILTWNAKLVNPPTARVICTLLILVVGFGVWALVTPNLPTFSPFAFAVLLQFFVLLAITYLLGPRAAERVAVSTLFLAVTLGVGVFVISQLGFMGFLPIKMPNSTDYGPSHILGLSSIRIAAYATAGFGLLLLSRGKTTNAMSYPITGLFTCVIGVLILVTGSYDVLTTLAIDIVSLILRFHIL